MPRKYRAIKNGLRFYAGSDTFAKIVASNGTGYPTWLGCILRLRKALPRWSMHRN